MHSAAEGYHLLLGAIPPCLGTPQYLVLRAICASNALSLLLPSLGDLKPQGEDAGDPAWSTSTSATPGHLGALCSDVFLSTPPKSSLHALQRAISLPGGSAAPSASCTGSESGPDSSMEPFFPRRRLFPSLHCSRSPRQRFQSCTCPSMHSQCPCPPTMQAALHPLLCPTEPRAALHW